MKVGILYIATGDYIKFWPDFYYQALLNFSRGQEVHFFIFTDNAEYFEGCSPNIHINLIDNLPWPYITLYRFRFFLKAKNQLINMDYLVFCNSNLLFRKEIDVLDCVTDKELFAVVHPGHFDKNPTKFPLEENTASQAFFVPDSHDKYVCGGFNGGKADAFLAMSQELSDAIDKDGSNNIIAKWHDETHLNRYYHFNKDLFNVLPSSFCSPRDSTKWGEVYVSVRDKHEVISLKHKGLFYVLKYKVRFLLVRLLNFLGITII